MRITDTATRPMGPPGHGAAQAYTVKPGDTLSAIAATHKVPLSEVVAANPQIKDPNVIHSGQEINIPPPKDPSVYVVQPGDTMSKIAKQQGVPLKDLIAANPQIKDPNKIYVGQGLKIPHKQAPEPSLPDIPPPTVKPTEPHAGVDRGVIEARLRNQTIQGLQDEARAAGLNATEASRLADSLRGLPSADFTREVGLLRDALASQNPDRALRTYLDLVPLRQSHPNRITPEIARTLVMGVGLQRTAASQGREGILGQDGALHAAQALTQMPQSEYQRISQLLNQAATGGAGSPGADAQTEQALILKAVAARSDQLSNPGWIDQFRMLLGMPTRATAEIENFANTIRGQDRAELVRRSTVMDIDGDAQDEAIQQRFKDSCAPTSAQIARAEADPVYAWRLHNEAIHSLATNTDIGQEQRRVMDDHGGVSVARGTAGSGVGVWGQDAMNDLASPYTHRTYGRREVANTNADRGAACDEMANLLRRGVDVPIEVAWNTGGAHALLVSDVRGEGANQQFLITDPWNGRTAWVNRQDIVNGNTNFMAGTGRLRTLIQ